MIAKPASYGRCKLWPISDGGENGMTWPNEGRELVRRFRLLKISIFFRMSVLKRHSKIQAVVATAFLVIGIFFR